MSYSSHCETCSNLSYLDRLYEIREPELTQHLNCRDRDGFTILHTVIREYYQSLFDILLRKSDIDLDIQDAADMSPLLVAIEIEANDFALRLVQEGCNVNTKDKNGITALMYAVRSADVDLSHAILLKGADVNEQDKFLCTALHHCCRNMNCELLDLLIYYGADTRIQNNKDEAFFMCFLKFPRPEEELVDYQWYMIDFEDDMNAINNQGISTLFLAIKYESPLLEEIIRRGADINYFYEDLNTLRLSLEVYWTSAFDLIWPRFDYNYVYSYTDRPLLCDFFHNYILNDWFHRFNIVSSSDIMEHAVQHYVSKDLPPLVSEIIKAFLRRGFDESDAFPYICAVLTFGSNVCLQDLETVCIYCGDDNDTTRFLLEMEIELSETILISYPYIMLNITEDPKDVLNKYSFPLNFRKIAEQVKFLPRLFKFCTPTDAFLVNLSLMRDKIAGEINVDDNSAETDFKKEVYAAYRMLIDLLNTKMCLIPSLLELSRNAARKFICLKYNLQLHSKYQSVVNSLVLPREVQRVLLFKVPVNNGIYKIPDFRIDSFSVQWSYSLYERF